MTDENTNTCCTNENPDNPNEVIAAPLSIVEEAKKIRDEIKAEREKLDAANEKNEKLQSEALLSGTSGGNVQAEKPVEDTPEDYVKKVMAGEIGDDKG